MKINSFKELIVWQKSRTLVKLVYGVCVQLPREEEFGISSQVKRSAVSIPSNIAEGYRRNSVNDYLRFLSIASGSAAELETQLILINDVFSVNTDEELALLEEVQKMLMVMKVKLEKTKP